MKKVVLVIEGMTCSACSNGLEKYLNKQKGIHEAAVNLVMGQAMISYEDYLTIDDLNNFVKEAGFKSLGEFQVRQQKKDSFNKKILIIYGFLVLLVVYIAMGQMINLPSISFLRMEDYPSYYASCLLGLTILFLAYGWNLFGSGVNNLGHGSPNMDTLVTMGVWASFLYSLVATIMIFKGNVDYIHNLYYESSCMVIYFVKLGRYIDNKSKEKMKSAISDLVRITPDEAVVKDGEKEKIVTLDEVNKGDILICKPSMKVAVDGEIVEGKAFFDESFITGEAVPVKKGKKDKVVAGSMNLDGTILYKALKIGKDSMISEIVRYVVLATNTKSSSGKMADKISGVFVPIIIILAFITFLGYLLSGNGLANSLNYFVTVLVVACPCALGLAVPLAIVVSEGLCAKRGILVKNGEILENAYKVKTIVFDKTGTLTYGKLKVSKYYKFGNISEQELWQIIGSLEAMSNHPIAKALYKKMVEEKVEKVKVDNFKDMAGVGITGVINDQLYRVGNAKILNLNKIKNKYEKEEKELASLGNSIVYLLKDREVIALFGIKDQVRDEARKVIKNLKRLNKDVILLTGDNKINAKLIGKELGIDRIIANVLPKEKVEVISKLKENGDKVMMVGDGINDAPSLTVADIGVAVAGGTDIANNSADVILIKDNLEKISELMQISKKTTINIKENLFWAFFYNILMIPTAMGLFKNFNIELNPMIASIAMTLSSLTVVLNALRLGKMKLRRDRNV